MVRSHRPGVKSWLPLAVMTGFSFHVCSQAWPRCGPHEEAKGPVRLGV